MTHFQENARTDGRMEERMEGQMEGQTDPILQDSSGYRRASKKSPVFS